MTLLVNIIGAGQLGKTLGHLFVQYHLVTIGSICNSSEISSLNAIKFIGEGDYCSSISELPFADITFITTPDELISKCCEELSKNKWIKKGSLILHCSGSLNSDALISIKEKGCYVASVHPMRSFAKPELSIKQYHGTYCAIEGDEEVVQQIHSLFQSIGSITYEIDKRKKSLYHAAGVFASNYLVTLSQQALECLRESGVEHEMAMRIITNMMQGTLSNLEQTLSPEHALTGPIHRGDVSTVLQHIKSLSSNEKKYLYSTLGKATLPLTDHNKMKKDKIVNALMVAE